MGLRNWWGTRHGTRWWRGWRLTRRVRKGKQIWGRQPGPNQLSTPMPTKATIRARVYRAATDTWEDLGVVSGGEEESQPS